MPDINRGIRYCRIIDRPSEDEYPLSSKKYIDLIEDEIPVLEQLQLNAEIIIGLFKSLTAEKLEYRYAEHKWTLKEVLVHLADDERIYAYRALRFARNDLTILSSFDQDLFTRNAGTGRRPLSNILAEYAATRASTIALFEGFTDEALMRRGKTDEWEGTVCALLYHLAGHEIHHLKIIREKYFTDRPLTRPNL